MRRRRPKITINKLSCYYGVSKVLTEITLAVPDKEVLGIMGPARSGKTTLLRTLNRLCDLEHTFRMEGQVLIGEEDIFGPQMDVAQLRKRISMVFAKPNPLPRSIFENLAYGPRLHGIRDKGRLAELVERGLKDAFLWDEVRDRLHLSALNLSGGQQQRLCLARTLAMEPEVVLLDEPTSGLDPISTAKIEETLQILKERLTIILVSNNVKQIARATDRTAFILMGEMVEFGDTKTVFTTPKEKKTSDYISGRFG